MIHLMRPRAAWCCGIVLSAACAAMAAGPDVVYSSIQSTANLGALGALRAYSLETWTCNIGNANLIWASQGTPGVGFQMYRLYNGRLEQLGLSWVKHSCCAAEASNPLCGATCTSTPGSNLLGVGCRDVYSATYNAGQSRLGKRININPYSGAFTAAIGAGSGTLTGRLQVQQADLNTTSFTGAQYFVEGVYVGTDDAQNFNWLNNGSYRRVTVSQTTWDLAVQDTTQIGIPAIQAWRDHGLGANTPDPSVDIFAADVPGEGRFWIGNKVISLGGGQYRYEYAVFNLNSERGAGRLSVPKGPGTIVTNQGFHDVSFHSGEDVDSADWTQSSTGCAVTWTTPPPPGASEANYVHWGTMYNFWFEANRPPVNGSVTLDLYQAGSPSNVSFVTRVPAGCPVTVGDVNLDAAVTSLDIQYFVNCMLTGSTAGGDCACADMNNDCSIDSVDASLLATDLVSP